MEAKGLGAYQLAPLVNMTPQGVYRILKSPKIKRNTYDLFINAINNYVYDSGSQVAKEIPLTEIEKIADSALKNVDHSSINTDQLSKSVLMAMEIIKRHAEALSNSTHALKVNAEALKVNAEASKINSETIRMQSGTMAEMMKKIPDSVKLPKGKTMADQPEFSSEIPNAKRSKHVRDQQK